jgi:6-phosphogluconate dehydrogenase
MLPAGDPTDEAVKALTGKLQRDDVIVDGGNTHFKDDVRRAKDAVARGIHYIDVGTSGGVWGASRGYCLMIGGPASIVARLTPIFRTLAPGQGTVPPTEGLDVARTTAHEGFVHCGPAGAGHFVKMVHNGIEYGLMQSYGEGFDILHNAPYDLKLDEIAEVWRRGSVVSSWLLDLAAIALAADRELSTFVRFGRRPMDGAGGDRAVGARRRHHHRALRAVSIAAGSHLRREAAVGAARAVRRSCRAPALIPACSSSSARPAI